MIVLGGGRWQSYALEEVARVEGGGTPSRNNKAFFGGDIPWVTPTDLPPIGRLTTLGSVAGSITAAGLAKSSAKLIPEGSVLFSSRASIGKIAVTDRVCTTNQGFANFIPDRSRVNDWFLAYLLAYHTADFVRLAGKTTFLEVPRGKLRSYRVQIPPLDEQQRIVTRIQECMERVDEIERLQADLEQEAAYILSAFRRDLWAEVDAVYDRILLECVVDDVKNGLYKPAQYHGTGALLLRRFNILDASFDVARLERLQVTRSELAKYGVGNGDILVSRVNSRELVAKSCLVEGLSEPGVHEAMLMRVRVKKDVVDPRLLVWLMNSPQFLQDIRRRAKHAIGQSSINQRDLLRSSFPLPPVARQRDIVAKAEGLLPLVRSLSAEIQGQLTNSRLLGKSILRKAFAGEL
jgi:type I restriction enzyme S subunit